MAEAALGALSIRVRSDGSPIVPQRPESHPRNCGSLLRLLSQWPVLKCGEVHFARPSFSFSVKPRYPTKGREGKHSV